MRPQILSLSQIDLIDFVMALRCRHEIRRFVDILLRIDPVVGEKRQLAQHWYTILSSGRLDHLAEVLAYTRFSRGDRDDVAAYFDQGAIHAKDYSMLPTTTIAHEAMHAFNHFHGLFGQSALDEGLSVIASRRVGSSALADNLAEATFGTILWHRDRRNHALALGSLGDLDRRAVAIVIDFVGDDASHINWLDERQIANAFQLFWKPLNRNVPEDVWIDLAADATWRTRKWIDQSVDRGQRVASIRQGSDDDG